MDWIAFAVQAFQEGDSPEKIMRRVPADQRDAVREALEAAAWLEHRAPAWEQLARQRTPSWHRMARRLPPPGHEARARRWRWSGLRQWALALTVLLAALWFGVTTVAAHALPGQWAYPVKRTLEQARYLAARNDEQRLALQLAFAEERLREAQRLLRAGDRIHADQALEGYQASLGAAFDLATSSPDGAARPVLEQAIARHQALLNAMADEGETPPPGLQHALEVLQANRERLERWWQFPPIPPEVQPSGKTNGEETGGDNNNPGQRGSQGQPGQGNGSGNGGGNGNGNGNPGHGGGQGQPGQGNGSGNGNGGGNGNGNGNPGHGGGQGQPGQGSGSGNGNGNGGGSGNGNGNPGQGTGGKKKP